MARILVIDDNAASLELMAYLLRAFGHIVREATDGIAGVAAAASFDPDVIVCDIQMPHLDGFGVAEHLRREAVRRAPLVAVTASAMGSDRDKVIAAGFDGYIVKPIDPERFVDQITAFLAPAG